MTIHPTAGEFTLLFTTDNGPLVTDLMRDRTCTIGGTTYSEVTVLEMKPTPGRSVPNWSVRGTPTTIERSV